MFEAFNSNVLWREIKKDSEKNEEERQKKATRELNRERNSFYRAIN